MEMAQEIVSKGFNPRSPCGERLHNLAFDGEFILFQPTLPLRGATHRWQRATQPHCFNPRSPCGERHDLVHSTIEHHFVSTHAPLAGSDATTPTWLSRASSFNPRSPCGERLRQPSRVQVDNGFQPTLPLRGATYGARVGARAPLVSTHAPLAGSDDDGATGYCLGDVSTHAPLAGSDHLPMFGHLNVPCFNPRSPCGERRARYCTSVTK